MRAVRRWQGVGRAGRKIEHKGQTKYGTEYICKFLCMFTV
jgi:hypothetical protein